MTETKVYYEGELLPKNDPNGIVRWYRIISIAPPIFEGCRTMITLSDIAERVDAP